MTLTVPISEFRNNISDYLNKVSGGARLIIKDEKKDKLIAEVIGKKEFDPVAFEKAVRKAAGVFTAKNHPEWVTRAKISKWLEKTRLANQRSV